MKNRKEYPLPNKNFLSSARNALVPESGDRRFESRKNKINSDAKRNQALVAETGKSFWVTLRTVPEKMQPVAVATQASRAGKTPDTGLISRLLEYQGYNDDNKADVLLVTKIAFLATLLILLANCSSANTEGGNSAGQVPIDGGGPTALGFTEATPATDSPRDSNGEEKVLAVPGEVETGTEEAPATPEPEGQPTATPVIVRRGDVIDRMVLELEKSGIDDTTVNIPEVGGTGGTYKITQEQVEKLKELVTAELDKLARETIIAKKAIPNIEGLASEEGDNSAETEGVQIVVSWTIDEDGKFHVLYTIAGNDENYSKNTGIMMVEDQEGQKVPLFASPEKVEQRILEETGVEVRVPIVVLDGNMPVALNESSEVVARVNPDTKQWEIMGQENEGLEVEVKPTQETSGSTVEPTAEPVIEPTTEPTPEASPTPSTPQGTAKNNANLRGGPGTNYDVVGGVKKGSSYEIIGVVATGGYNWYELDNGGWVRGDMLAEVANRNQIPTVPKAEIPPAPTPAPKPSIILKIIFNARLGLTGSRASGSLAGETTETVVCGIRCLMVSSICLASSASRTLMA